MTRFGEILPLRYNLKKLLPFLDNLFSILQNCEPTLANISYFRANFHCSKWPNTDIIRSHLVTLLSATKSLVKTCLKSYLPLVRAKSSFIALIPGRATKCLLGAVEKCFRAECRDREDAPRRATTSGPHEFPSRSEKSIRFSNEIFL